MTRTEGYQSSDEITPKWADKDFWALYLAHLSFLCKDYQQASALIDSVRTTKPELLKQKSRTQFSLYLAQLKFIGTDEEKTIRQYLQTSNADEDFINEIVGHLYKMQKDYGKAFLTHNRIEDLRQNPDPNIINSLMSNAEKENDQALLTQLYELEGTYFLRMNNFEEAAKWFAKVPAILQYHSLWLRLWNREIYSCRNPAERVQRLFKNLPIDIQ